MPDNILPLDDRTRFKMEIVANINACIQTGGEGLSLEDKGIAAVELIVEMARGYSYPATSLEVTDSNMKFKLGVIPALRAFKERSIEQLSNEERLAAMRELVTELARIYEITPPTLAMENIDGSHSGASSYNPTTHTITMRGKLSIITLLHEFTHSRGMDEYGAVCWSASLFKRVYPEQYERLAHVGHTLVNPTQAPAAPAQPIRVVVEIDGGRCDKIYSNVPIEAEVIDYDTEGSEEENLITLEEGGDKFYLYGANLTQVNPEYVDLIFETASAKRGQNQDADNTEDTKQLFRNHYRCVCGHEWEDVWSATCDDRCPECDKPISPYFSKEEN